MAKDSESAASTSHRELAGGKDRAWLCVVKTIANARSYLDPGLSPSHDVDWVVNFYCCALKVSDVCILTVTLMSWVKS